MNRAVRLIERYKLLHIAYWIWAFIGLYHERLQHTTGVLVPPLYATALLVLSEMLAVYATLYLVLPATLKKEQYVLFGILSVLTCVLAGIAGTAMMGAYIYLATGSPMNHLLMWTISNTVDNFMATAIFVAVITVAARYHASRRTREIEKERLETELSFLKAQINPHFLFNAINSVYVLIRLDPDQASSTLLKFSDLLRYQLYECKDNFVQVSRELKFLRGYISLESVRRGNKVEVITRLPDNPEAFNIAPFLLIPLVENAFKFVSLFKDRNNFIRIEGSVEDEVFTFSIANTVDDADQLNGQPGGIGLQNVQRRLELLYPDRHELTTTRADGIYQVNLKLHATTHELYYHG